MLTNTIICIQLGNPETSTADDWRGLVDYAWSHAVISDETHKIISRSCDFNSSDPWSNDDCNDAVGEVLKQYKEIDIYSLYTSVCMSNSMESSDRVMQVMMKHTHKMVQAKFENLVTHQIFYLNIIVMTYYVLQMPRIMSGYDPCLDDYARAFYNRPDVQKALHVSDGVRLRNWSICK